jgi:hypothetical protein
VTAHLKRREEAPEVPFRGLSNAGLGIPEDDELRNSQNQ